MSIEDLQGRPELLSCLKGGTYSQSHVELSKELALANPELTLPLFCGEYIMYAHIHTLFGVIYVKLLPLCDDDSSLHPLSPPPLHPPSTFPLHLLPSLFLPLPPPLIEMVLRFEMSSLSGRRGLLQYMVPWLQNIELVEDSPVSQPQGIVVQQAEYIQEVGAESTGNSVLTGSGWGSPEATKVVLHNLLYITAKVRRLGEEYV